MKKQHLLIFASVLIVLFAVALLAQNKPVDPYGKADKAEVVVRQVKPNHFVFELGWENDEKLAAMTFPLIIKGKSFKMHYDSVSWKGRAEYFAVKSVHPVDSLQQVLVGLLADINGNNPPLIEGKGILAKLYFTAEPATKKAVIDVCEIMVDTTTVEPSNTLYAVIPDGTGTVHPSYTVVKMSAAGQPTTCK
jgi:hypothetical protein